MKKHSYDYRSNKPHVTPWRDNPETDKQIFFTSIEKLLQQYLFFYFPNIIQQLRDTIPIVCSIHGQIFPLKTMGRFLVWICFPRLTSSWCFSKDFNLFLHNHRAYMNTMFKLCSPWTPVLDKNTVKKNNQMQSFLKKTDIAPLFQLKHLFNTYY